MQLPENGFYYHFKHDPSLGVTHHAYEVIGIGWHTEEESLQVLYRPLYDADFMSPATVAVRPLTMFAEEIERDGVRVSRFSQITDTELVNKLDQVRNRMYPV